MEDTELYRVTADDLPEDIQTVRMLIFDDGNQCDKCSAKPAASFGIPVHAFGYNSVLFTACRPHALEPFRAVQVFEEWYAAWRAGRVPSSPLG